MLYFAHYLILSLSVLFQLAAAILALHLIKVTGRRLGWILISLANLFMIYRRVLSFVAMHCDSKNFILSNEIAGLVISITMFLGISMIKKYFVSILEVKDKIYTNHQELEKINKSKDRLFSIISHDLKNPFNTILNFSHLLLRNYKQPLPEKAYDFIKRIHKSARCGYTLLENLLQWSRFQTGTIDLVLGKLNLNLLVEQNILLLEENAKSKDISIINELDIHLFILADENMISTVIRNLLSNAIKFTPIHGKITISKQVRESDVVLNIADTGVGMSAKEVHKLFKLETNSSKPGTDSEQGSGLGLVICREFIRQNNGRIWVESEEGKGSMFSFCIPFHCSEN
jgi:two-component system, sensor histidine kinase and response regulator